MQNDKQTILERLDKTAFYKSFIPSLKETGKNQALGLCPFHDDNNPSLSINLKDGLWNCLSGCGGGSIFDFHMRLTGEDFPTAMKELAKIAGVTETAVKQKVVATFKYKDVDGKTLYSKERLEPGKNGRGKDFRFKNHLTGKHERGCDPVLYNLQAVSNSKYALIGEGEGKVELWKEWGLVATCLDSGAGSPWKDEYTKALEGKEKVVILPDNDSPGRSYASKIAKALNGKVGSLKVVELPGLEEAEDVIDWSKKEGNDKERLLELIKEAPEWIPTEEPEASEAREERKQKVKAIGIADFLSLEFPPRENILDPWLPMQGLCMVHAPRGIGKTFLGLNIAVAVTSRGQFLRWRAPKERGVLLLDGEMPGIVLQERLSYIIASVDEEPTAPLTIITPDLQPSGMPNLIEIEGQEAIEPYLKDISLVIVDNISTLCRGGRENEGESWLPVQEWALKLRSRGISVLFIHHSGKGGQQRGTSRREDVLDTVISLKHPAEYRPDMGACFEVHFEKSRGIYGDVVKPFEARMETHGGKYIWTLKDLEESLTDKVAELMKEGIPQHEIAELLGKAKGTISKHVKKAKMNGVS